MCRFLTLSLAIPFFLSLPVAAQEGVTRDLSPPEAVGEVAGENAVPDTDVKEGEPEDASKLFQSFRLGEIDPQVALAVVQSMLAYDPAVRIEVDPNNDTLIFFGTKQQAQAVTRVFEALRTVPKDTEITVDGSDVAKDRGQPSNINVRVYKLDDIRADDARRTLLTLYPPRLGDSDERTIRIEVEEDSNSLIVFASPDRHWEIGAVLDQIIERASRGTSEKWGRVHRVFGLKYPVDSQEVAQRFEKTFGDDGDWAVTVRADQIDFFGTEEQIQAAANLVAQLNQREIKIFQMDNANAAELATLIKELYPSPALTVVADVRTNSIAASGSADDLTTVQAVIGRLDEAATVKEAFGAHVPSGDNRPDSSIPDSDARDAMTSQLRKEYEAAERIASDSAKAYRMASHSGDLADEDLEKLKTNVSSAVKRAFDLRQQLQSAEVEELRKRLAEIEQRVQRRKTLKDRIIERRVEDLLTDVDLTWSPPAGMASDREPHVSLLRPRSMEAAERAAKVGPMEHAVQVEMMPGTDRILVRGAEQDVRAFTRIMENLEQADAISRAAKGKRVRVDFSQAPWEDVLEWLAEQCGVTFDAVEVPPGTFSLSRSEPAPLDDIFRDIRTRLFHKGYAVELDDGNLRVRPRTTTSRTPQPTGLSSPVEIEALEGSDQVVVRGNVGDIARAAARIDELDQTLTEDKDAARADPEKSTERSPDHAKQEPE